MDLVLVATGDEGAKERFRSFLNACGISADKDIELARLGVIFHLLIPELQRLNIDREADSLSFARFQGDFLKAFQLFHRATHGSRHILQV